MRRWQRVRWIMALSLGGCVELPGLPAPDAAVPVDVGHLGRDAGAGSDAALDATMDAGATLADACLRPEAAGLRFRALGDVLVLDEASVTPFGTEFTFEAWMRLRPPPPSAGTGGTLFARKDEVDGGLVFNVVYGPPTRLCVHRDTANATHAVCTSDSLPFDVWLHAAFVIDGSEARVWIDGIQRAAGDLLTPLHPSATPLYGTTVGGSWDPSLMRYKFPTSADIDELALHRSLRYQAAFTPPPSLVADASTVGLYRLDERAGTLAADASGHAAPATLHQGEWLDGCQRRAYFGDGLDGSAHVQGRLELTRDMDYEALHVLTTGEFVTRGHRIRVRGTATLDGTVQDNGAPNAPGGLVHLQVSRLSGTGTLSARGGDGSASEDADGAPGGEVRVVTEDQALPAELSVAVQGGVARGAGAPGAAGRVVLESVAVP